MKHHYINKEKNFIAGFYTEDFNTLDSVLDLADNVYPYPGETEGGVNTSIKDSYDTVLYGFVKSAYLNNVLYPALQEYLKIYEWANKSFVFDVIEEVITKFKQQNKIFDFVCCLYSCAPFTTENNLKLAFKAAE